jgi:hypothetical protein
MQTIVLLFSFDELNLSPQIANFYLHHNIGKINIGQLNFTSHFVNSLAIESLQLLINGK